jgi:hypothetical protein
MMWFREVDGSAAPDFGSDFSFNVGDLLIGVTEEDWDDLYNRDTCALTSEFKEWAEINAPTLSWTTRRVMPGGKMSMETILVFKFANMTEIIHFKMRFQKGS